jgi:hypothetical protein
MISELELQHGRKVIRTLHSMPIPFNRFLALCTCIVESEEGPNDVDFKTTEEFIRKHRLPKAKLLAWFKQNNVNCDDDIIMNLFLPMSDVAEHYMSRHPLATAQR